MKPLFFLHIPKTGGTTLDYAIRPLFENPAPRMSWAEAQAFDFTGYDYIAGHYPYSFVELHGLDCDVITLFRDPVQRVLSHYAYVHEFGYWRDADFSEWVKQASLAEWLESDRTVAHTNLMTRFLIDRETDDLTLSLLNRDRLAAYGVLEQNGIPQLANWICERLGKSPITIFGHDNAGPPKPPIDEHLTMKIMKQNVRDMMHHTAIKLPGHISA